MVKALTDEQILEKALEQSGFNDVIKKLLKNSLDALKLANKNSLAKPFIGDIDKRKSEISQGIYDFRNVLIDVASDINEIEKYLEVATKLSKLDASKKRMGYATQEYWDAKDILVKDLGFTDKRAEDIVNLAHYSGVNIFKPLEELNSWKVLEDINRIKDENLRAVKEAEKPKQRTESEKNNGKEDKGKKNTGNKQKTVLNETNNQTSETETLPNVTAAELERKRKEEWEKMFQEADVESDEAVENVEAPQAEGIQGIIMNLLKPLFEMLESFGFNISSFMGNSQTSKQENSEKQNLQEIPNGEDESKKTKQKAEESKAEQQTNPKDEKPEKQTEQKPEQEKQGKNTNGAGNEEPKEKSGEEAKDETASVEVQNNTILRQPTQEEIDQAKRTLDGRENPEDIASMITDLNSNLYQGDFTSKNKEQRVV